MPTYDTPNPIDLAIDVRVGSIEIFAGDRADTVVTISATNPGRSNDDRGARDTNVDFDGQRLTITGPRPRLNWLGPSESIDVKVELPAGSRLTAENAVGSLRTVGRLGATRIKNSLGTVEVDSTGDLWLKTSHGNANLGTASGEVEITADRGQIRIGTVTGNAILKSSHGSIQVEESGGDVEVKLSYGDLEITRARGSVSAKTAKGSLRIGEISSGSIELESGMGQITVGVRTGTATWLDLAAKHGRVRNQLDGAAAPDEAEQSVAVRARTQFGDIRIQRAS